jgi:hypothetical protein
VVEIRWEGASSVVAVEITLYKGGELAAVVAEAADNTGVLEWTVAADIAAGENYLLVITDAARASVSAYTPRDFAIIISSECQLGMAKSLYTFVCTPAQWIEGVADLLLSNNKTADTGFTRASCEDECMTKDVCQSFVFKAADGYCELWSTFAMHSEAPEGNEHCVRDPGITCTECNRKTYLQVDPTRSEGFGACEACPAGVRTPAVNSVGSQSCTVPAVDRLAAS